MSVTVELSVHDVVQMTPADLRKLADQMDQASGAGSEIHHPLGEIHMYPGKTVAVVGPYCETV